MDIKTEEKLAAIFNSLNPSKVHIEEFPVGDAGENSGDATLAEAIVYGFHPPAEDYGNNRSLSEDQVAWAIKLGRALAISGIDPETGKDAFSGEKDYIGPSRRKALAVGLAARDEALHADPNDQISAFNIGALAYEEAMRDQSETRQKLIEKINELLKERDYENSLSSANHPDALKVSVAGVARVNRQIANLIPEILDVLGAEPFVSQ